MPLVFVHGVNTRRGDTDKEKEEFDERVKNRDKQFKEISLAGLVPPPVKLHIENPYWGDHAARFSHDLASLPGPTTEIFGSEEKGAMAEVLMQTLSPAAAAELKPDEAETGLLLALARERPGRTEAHLELAIDALVAAASCQPATDGDVTSTRQDLAGFAAAATAYLATSPDLGWIFARDHMTGQPRLGDDCQFIDALMAKVEPFMGAQAKHETFGGGAILNRLKQVASALGGAAKRITHVIAATGMGAAAGAVAAGAPGAGTALGLLRPAATQRAGIFLGDVFAYLSSRGTNGAPGEIVRIVLDALRAADAARTAEDSKLVVVAHSMGGNIVYDILTHFDLALRVDALVTVGSQVAVFKELGLYVEDAGQRLVAPERIKKPDNVGAWLNVFDPLDLLGFAVGGVFAGVTDYAFASQASPLDAHTTYFLKPSVHQRLRARLVEIGLGTAA